MASARPSAVVRFSAKIETSVPSATNRNTAIEPTIANAPTATGTAAASSPLNTHTSTRKLSGSAMASITTTSRWVWALIWEYTIAEPPARTVTSG